MKSLQFLLVPALVILTGCMATQPVTWNKSGDMDLTKGGKVAVEASCEIPPADLAYLQTDIQEKVKAVLTGNDNTRDAYKVEVTITKYDKGNAFARFMLIGLGQMYLYGTVEITQGNPPVVIREGEFKKNYCVGGLVGGTASMQKDVLPKVGKAIADAITMEQAK